MSVLLKPTGAHTHLLKTSGGTSHNLKRASIITRTCKFNYGHLQKHAIFRPHQVCSRPRGTTTTLYTNSYMPSLVECPFRSMYINMYISNCKIPILSVYRLDCFLSFNLEFKIFIFLCSVIIHTIFIQILCARFTDRLRDFFSSLWQLQF